MGNKVCKHCVTIVKGSKSKVRKPTNSSTSTTVSSSFNGLSLEDYLDSNSNANSPVPMNGFQIPLFSCQICFESKPLNDSFNVEDCSHFYCTKCTIKYIVSKLQDNVLNLMCPESGCSGVLNPVYCKPILPDNVLVWWEKALSESVIPERVRFYCPFNDCSALLINESGVIRDSTCPHCKRGICVKCKAPWHQELSCKKFQKMKHKNDDLMRDLAKRRKWRRCPNCKNYVEKFDGCDDMKCRCYHRFCYNCGASKPSYNHVCFH